MSSPLEINVHMGEIKIGREGQVLKTLLGSCVGIGIFWKAQKIYGLAHCLLPEIIQSGRFHTEGRFVEQAIPNLFQMMHIPPEKYSEIEAVVVGGGNMTNPKVCSPSSLVGFANTKLAKEMLNKMGIRIVHEEIGGEEGRKLFINCSSGEYKIEVIPRLIAV